MSDQDGPKKYIFICYLIRVEYFQSQVYFLGLHWHDLSDLKAICNKKSIEMAQKGPFLPFLIFSQTKTMKTF
jgi:hypothetical protein